MQKLNIMIDLKTRILYLFIGLIILIVSIMLFAIWLFNKPCNEFEKPANVPVSAIWKGGCDGGNWVELVDIRVDTIRFRIYNQSIGDLMLDADFVPANCDDLQLTKTNWNKYISFFDGTILYTKFVSNDHYCRLVPIFPAYYEEKIK